MLQIDTFAPGFQPETVQLSDQHLFGGSSETLSCFARLLDLGWTTFFHPPLDSVILMGPRALWTNLWSSTSTLPCWLAAGSRSCSLPCFSRCAYLQSKAVACCYSCYFTSISAAVATHCDSDTSSRNSFLPSSYSDQAYQVFRQCFPASSGYHLFDPQLTIVIELCLYQFVVDSPSSWQPQFRALHWHSLW